MDEKHVLRILVTLIDAKNKTKIAYVDPTLATTEAAKADTLNMYEQMLTKPIQIRAEIVSVLVRSSPPTTIEE